MPFSLVFLENSWRPSLVFYRVCFLKSYFFLNRRTFFLEKMKVFPKGLLLKWRRSFQRFFFLEGMKILLEGNFKRRWRSFQTEFFYKKALLMRIFLQKIKAPTMVLPKNIFLEMVKVLPKDIFLKNLKVFSFSKRKKEFEG